MRMLTALAALAIAASAAGLAPQAEAKGKYLCKPAITGWGSHSFAHKAKAKAIASYKAKAAAAYGTIVWNNKIGDHCTKLQKGLGWQCWVKAEPCVDGGLKPSISKSPALKAPRLKPPRLQPPRLRVMPGLDRRRGLLRPERGATTTLQRSSVLSGGFRLR